MQISEQGGAGGGGYGRQLDRIHPLLCIFENTRLLLLILLITIVTFTIIISSSLRRTDTGGVGKGGKEGGSLVRCGTDHLVGKCT